jgi:lipopolysaccharide transport system ATP-binding protein
LAAQPVIRVEGLGKQYRLGAGVQYGRLTETLSEAIARPYRALRRRPTSSNGDRYLWSLRDLDFEVHEGDVVGIVGRNGAGKTTLLKLLSRITEPTEGYAELRGSVGSLLEVGTGFHPELTGRENVYLNGAILGMTRSEMDRKFDEIVDFAEIHKFMDTPVKRYSSGMYVRLAFSVSAFLEPDILIVDEVLAVGDISFQKKCLGKMGDVARGGRTVLFVSHNIGAVAELCTRAILLEQGCKIGEGEVSKVLDQYSRMMSDRGKHGIELEASTDKPVDVVGIRVATSKGQVASSFDISDGIRISIEYEVKERLHGLQLTVTLARNMVDVTHSFDTDLADEVLPTDPGRYVAHHVVPPIFLKAGIYTVRLGFGTPEELFHDLQGAASFDIDDLSENTHFKGYRQDRPGHVISPGTWERERIE